MMEKALIRLFAFLSQKDWHNFVKELQSFQKPSEIRTVEEALLISYLFLGFPATLTAFEYLNEQYPYRKKFYIDNTKNWQLWKKRGLKLFKIIYDKNSMKLIKRIKKMHPDLLDWMITEGYGKVLSREFLDIRTKELLIITILISSGWEKQLHSHYIGALNVGVKPKEIEELFNILRNLNLNEDNLKKAILLWEEKVKKKALHNLKNSKE